MYVGFHYRQDATTIEPGIDTFVGVIGSGLPVAHKHIKSKIVIAIDGEEFASICESSLKLTLD